jgi:hypothetical protein
MTAVVDNLIAWRVLNMLVKPFNETEAYKLGIIDDKGTNLIKARDFTTQDQKDAYTYLHRLVFNLKKLINKLPGGESKTKNIVAAFFLLKEAYPSRSTHVDEQRLFKLIEALDAGVVLAEEQLIVDEFFMCEEMGAGGVAANVTGAAVSTDIPVIRRKPKRFARFVVGDDVYNKFAAGKAKYRRQVGLLNTEDVALRSIYEFSKKNPNAAIILHNGKETKAVKLEPTKRHYDKRKYGR